MSGIGQRSDLEAWRLLPNLLSELFDGDAPPPALLGLRHRDRHGGAPGAVKHAGSLHELLSRALPYCPTLTTPRAVGAPFICTQASALGGGVTAGGGALQDVSRAASTAAGAAAVAHTPIRMQLARAATYDEALGEATAVGGCPRPATRRRRRRRRLPGSAR